MNLQERAVAIDAMQRASHQFYAAAVSIGVHPFIEFSGLMNEYIKACQHAHNIGVDFTACSKHAGQHLPMRDYEIDYVNEKLECIFTGRSVMRDKS